MEWKWCDRNGEESEEPTNFQTDSVGNILQRSGALVVKACQNCKKDFMPKVQMDELRQQYKEFGCNDCDFKSPVAQDALLHTLDNEDHKLKAVKESHIVGYKKTLVDSAIVNPITRDGEIIDYSILCKICNDINRT